MLETQDVCRYQAIVGVPCTLPPALDAQERYGNRQDEHGAAMWAWLGRAVTVSLHQEANGRRGRYEHRQNCAR